MSPYEDLDYMADCIARGGDPREVLGIAVRAAREAERARTLTPEEAMLADALIRIGYPNALDETDYKLLAKLGQIAGDR